jgi:hypothetical protein
LRNTYSQLSLSHESEWAREREDVRSDLIDTKACVRLFRKGFVENSNSAHPKPAAKPPFDAGKGVLDSVSVVSFFDLAFISAFEQLFIAWPSELRLKSTVTKSLLRFSSKFRATIISVVSKIFEQAKVHRPATATTLATH